MNQFSVLHLIDTLNPGGAERMAVNLANETARRGHRAHLCATRSGGDLQPQLLSQVGYLCLNRRQRISFPALSQLVRYIHRNQVQIIHAHSSSLFLAVLLHRLIPRLRVIWHYHSGQYRYLNSNDLLYRWLVRSAWGVIAVNKPLADWATHRLKVSAERVWQVPNFSVLDAPAAVPQLPGPSGSRIVCVANLRPQKDHLTLLRSMQQVIQVEPRAHLILVGSASDPVYHQRLADEIKRLDLNQNITWLGPRSDIAAILRGCDIGVLSSISEGLPVTLLEYGAAGLAAVCTRVGDCATVLEEGRCGILVHPSEVDSLANAIIRLLQDEALRKGLAENFQLRVQQHYSPEAVLSQIFSIYQRCLNKS